MKYHDEPDDQDYTTPRISNKIPLIVVAMVLTFALILWVAGVI